MKYFGNLSVRRRKNQALFVYNIQMIFAAQKNSAKTGGKAGEKILGENCLFSLGNTAVFRVFETLLSVEFPIHSPESGREATVVPIFPPRCYNDLTKSPCERRKLQ